MSKRAQLSAIDLFAGATLVVFALILVLFLWNQYHLQIQNTIGYNGMVLKAITITDVLVKNEGSPQNWDATTVEIIGLASSDHILSPLKVSLLDSLTNTKISDTFKLSTLNFRLVLKDSEGTILVDKGTPNTGTQSVKVLRRALYNGERASLELELWT